MRKKATDDIRLGGIEAGLTHCRTCGQRLATVNTILTEQGVVRLKICKRCAIGVQTTETVGLPEKVNDPALAVFPPVQAEPVPHSTPEPASVQFPSRQHGLNARAWAAKDKLDYPDATPLADLFDVPRHLRSRFDDERMERLKEEANEHIDHWRAVLVGDLTGYASGAVD